MARINNKFATQNLNDIFGKRERKPQAAADSTTAAGCRSKGGSAHGGGMLVLRPPVKQPPTLLKDLKTTATPGLRRDAPPPPSPQAENRPVSSTDPPSSLNSNENSNTIETPAPSPAVEISSSASKNLTVAAVEIPKGEPSDSISLRPNQNHRPEIYIPPAVRNLAALEKTNEILPPKRSLTPPSADPVMNKPEPGLEKPLETVKDEPPGAIVTPAPEVVKSSRPEPFRPPQLRGDAARRVEPMTAPLPPLDDSNSNSNPGRGGWDRDNHRPNNFQQRSRRDEDGRFSRDVLQQRQRFERDRRGGGNGGGYYNRDGNSHPSSYAYSRSAPEVRNYDIEVIRPGSGGSDRFNNGNNRDFAYGGRQVLDRQVLSPPSYSYWGEGQGQGQGHANYELYEHRQDFNRRNYNNSQFKSGGMNHRDFQNRDGGYMPGRDGGGQQRRDQSYGRSGQGQFRDNFAEKAHANGRFSAPPREQQEGGNFRQFPRMQRDNYGGGGYRYNDPARFGGDGYQRPRSGGYEGVSPRPRSSGYGSNAGAGRFVGPSDSAVSRGNFYNGRRSPISQDKVGHKEFGPQGKYHYDGSMSKMNEMQSADVGYQRPRSGGYGGPAAGRSMAPSDTSRFNNFNGPRLPISREMPNEDFSRRLPDQYHADGTFPTECEVQDLDFGSNRELENSMDSFNEFDSYRTRRENEKAEPSINEEHQNMAWDSSLEYNMLNLEPIEKGEGNEDSVAKSDYRLDVEQKFHVEDKRHYYTEEDKKVDIARKETVKQDQHAKGIPLQLRQEGSLEQEMRKEVTEMAINREPVLESIDSHPIINEASEQLKEEHNPPNIDLNLQEQDRLADRFASSRITVGRNPRLVQHDSTSNTRPRNYHGGRDAGLQPNSYTSRSSAMSWRREPNEIKNGPPQRSSGQYGDYNYGQQSRELSSSDRYQADARRFRDGFRSIAQVFARSLRNPFPAQLKS